jgi:hypothetical protein
MSGREDCVSGLENEVTTSKNFSNAHLLIAEVESDRVLSDLLKEVVHAEISSALKVERPRSSGS